ncbi:major capsid protein [Mycobacterium phage SoYo]|uniref:Major capsid protein n=43 Tax=Microwolfvirus TaxID=2942894 RepID=A0A345L1C5_9CAUD|nr:major capsid protein [Mycobacterium phage Bxz2]YP_009195115.1 major capsid protein [Mycobacterium phage Tiffany]YP_009198442.1 major capsid protein [Mycobacterium phage MarQuardt]YP_009219078.1 major capsid protein [Mycobacterium phage Anubis]YP_009617263.1 gp17 [Mycobacterium phage Wonder]YP_009635607.1 major capsid protein [Mycobacterium phage JHC117]YP_009635692.1 major capsid protein [Mycobacterium phage Microwolf]AEK07679.1 major capsid protein [Mycobacterium phage Vix]AGK87218.1 ma
MAGSTVPSTQVALTGDFSAFLTPEQSQDYFAEIEKTSIVQRIARKVPMGPTGISIPHWTGAVSASWTGEAERKPITKGSFGKQELEPVKITTIFAESAEVVRLNPLNYLNTMRTKIAEAIALKFDAAAIHGIDKPSAFKGYLAETTKVVSLADTNLTTASGPQGNAYLAVNNALSLLVNSGKKWTGTLLDNVTEPILNTAVDGNGRPLFVESTYTEQVGAIREGRILGRPTYVADNVVNGTVGNRVVGVMGDFSQVIWGQIGGLSFDVTDQATLDFGEEQGGVWVPKLISLWQHNMVAVRCEAEFAFMVNDKDAFVKLTDQVAGTDPEEE